MNTPLRNQINDDIRAAMRAPRVCSICGAPATGEGDLCYLCRLDEEFSYTESPEVVRARAHIYDPESVPGNLPGDPDLDA